MLTKLKSIFYSYRGIAAMHGGSAVIFFFVGLAAMARDEAILAGISFFNVGMGGFNAGQFLSRHYAQQNERLYREVIESQNETIKDLGNCIDELQAERMVAS